MTENAKQTGGAPRSSRKATEEQSKNRAKSDTKLLLTLLSYGDSALRSGVSGSAGGFKKLTSRGQLYLDLGGVDHVTRDSRTVVMRQMASTCADCGRLFVTQALRSAIRKGWISRRCQACKKPGVPVRKKAKGPARRRKAVKRVRRAAAVAPRNRPVGPPKPMNAPQSLIAAVLRRAAAECRTSSRLVELVNAGVRQRAADAEALRVYREAMGMVRA